MEYQFESLGPTLRIVVLIFLCVFALAVIGVLVLLAALPGEIARRRNHPQASAVNICGWLGLPTGIVWVVAMGWSLWSYEGSDASPALSAQLDVLEAAVEKLESKINGASS
ncbi:MAG: DUF3302 domain-containing protein [Aureliella sp.]